MTKIKRISIRALGNRSKYPPITAATAPEAPITGTSEYGLAANCAKLAKMPAAR